MKENTFNFILIFHLFNYLSQWCKKYIIFELGKEISRGILYKFTAIFHIYIYIPIILCFNRQLWTTARLIRVQKI